MMKMQRIVVLGAALSVGGMSLSAPLSDSPVFVDFLYATQYYRAPTPLASEWEDDLAKLGDYRLNTIQLRLNWRQNERQEDVYSFEDVDRLMDLAEKYGKKVIIKFLLECAPQYVFDKCHGTRVGPRGEKLPGVSHGAFYTGGWLPCFTNPKVADRAAKFVRKVAERYCGRKNLIAWNAWNEPRNRPIEECFCDACRRGYGRYLKDKFGTIEKLNAFYGVAEESFESIALPGGTDGYWDVFEFKQYKSGVAIHNNLKMVRDAVREFDSVRPVVSHVGWTCGFQCGLGDACDDFAVSRAVDGWGTSLPLYTTSMKERADRLEFGRLNDFMRCVDPNYFIYEVYPGLGMFNRDYDDVWDMDYKLYGALACGAKGINFWQYRAERVGCEADCAGLARADGSPRPVLQSVRAFGDVLANIRKDVVGFYPKQAEVAIVYDYKSLLLSEIEDEPGLSSYLCNDDRLFYYTDTHRGFYGLMRQKDIPVDYLNMSKVGDILKYKVAYFPNCTMLDPAVAPVLERFVAQGGVLIADEGFGLRQPNTWMNPYDIACGTIMKARLSERRLDERAVVLGDKPVPTKGYHSEYRVENARTLVPFANGKPAVQEVSCGKGRTCILGFSLGYAVARTPHEAWSDVFDLMTAGLGLQRTAYGRFNENLEERRLFKGNEQYLFLINSSCAARTVDLKEPFVEVGTKGCLVGNRAVIRGRSCLILKSVQ